VYGCEEIITYPSVNGYIVTSPLAFSYLNTAASSAASTHWPLATLLVRFSVLALGKLS